MDIISIRVNLIIAVKDGFTGLPEPKGRVIVKTRGGIFAEKRSGGSFVFIRCHEGLYRIIIESENYRTVSFDALMSDKPRTIEVTLAPSRTYPFFGSVTRLFGKAPIPVSDSPEIKAVFIADPSEARLMAPCKKGDGSLKLFLGKPYPGGCSGICFISGKNHEIYKLSFDGEDPMTAECDPPIKKNIPADAEIGFVYDIMPDDKGDYFTAVRGKYRRALILGCGDPRTLELLPDETGTRYDII